MTQNLPEPMRSAIGQLLADSKDDHVVLPVVTALEELTETLRETKGGAQPPQPGDRGSLTQDVDRALTGAGSQINTSTDPSLRKFRNRHLPGLAEVLASSEKAAGLQAETESLVEQLRQPRAALAAWDDLVAAVRTGAPIGECRQRANQLKELIRLRGHDWWPMQMSLTAPLQANDLERCGELLSAAAPSDLVSVWLVFGNAWLDVPLVRVGQIQFFNDQLTPKNIRDGCPALSHPEFEPARELSDDVDLYFDSIPSEHFVWARVELQGPRAREPERGLSQPPIEWARHLAAAAVEAAAVQLGGSRWQLLEGGVYFTADGQSGGRLGFDNPADLKAAKEFVPPPHEETAAMLTQLPAAFIEALAREERSAVRAIDRVRWHDLVAASPDPAMRVVTYVKTFEDEWATDPKGWESATRRFLRDMWCRDVQDTTLMRAGWAIKHLHEHLLLQAKQAAAEIFESAEGNRFVIDLRAVAAHAGSVADALPAGSLERRQLSEISGVTRSGERLQVWWTQLRGDFDTLLNRGVRQRNRIVHGRTALPRLLDGCEAFLARLASYLVVEAVRAVAEGRSSQEVFKSQRDRLEQLFQELSAGSLESLYSEPGQEPPPGDKKVL